MNARQEKLIEFLKEIDKYKLVERQIYIPGRANKETDAEHSWHMAMFLWLFADDLPKGLDLLKMMKMALMHDLPEIYAGDTFAFDEEGRKTKKEREKKAAEKLFSQLPNDLKKEFTELFREFEECKTPEAKAAVAFDKIHAAFEVSLTESRIHKELDIKPSQIEEYHDRVKADDPLTKELIRTFCDKVKGFLEEKNR